jgi:hypothetical protein
VSREISSQINEYLDLTEVGRKYIFAAQRAAPNIESFTGHAYVFSFLAGYSIFGIGVDRSHAPRSNSKCNNSIELIHGDSRSRAVGKWKTSFVFHLFHGCFVPSHGQS